MKLIICGNGFDLNHRLRTGYKCYRCYLQDYAPGILSKFEKLPWLSKQPHQDAWHNVEETLRLDLDAILNTIKQYEIKCGTDNEIECLTDIDDWLRFIHLFTGELFYQWLSAIDTGKAVSKSDLAKCFEDAIFVNFNYTDTLECVYGIPAEKVLHIHGALADVRSDLCFGDNILPSFSTIEEAECYDKPLLECDKWNSDVIRDIIQFGAPREWQEISSTLESAFSAEGQDLCKYLCEMLPKTIKTLSKNIPALENFLRDKVLDEIVVMGHSLGGPDDFYYEKYFVPMYGSKKWTFFWHRNSDNPSAGKDQIEQFCKKNDIVPHYCEW